MNLRHVGYSLRSKAESVAVRRRFVLASTLIALSLGSVALAGAPPPQPAPEPPSIAFGALYRTVEMTGVFPDQKTFADAIPNESPAEVLAAFEQQKLLPGFDLKAFVAQHFTL